MKWTGLLKSGALFFTGDVLTRLVNFLAYTLYTHFLAPEELGYYDVSIAYGTIVGSLFLMDVWVGVMKAIMTAQRRDQVDSVIRSGLVVVGLATALIGAIAWILDIINPVAYIWLVFLCIIGSGLQNYWGFVARAREKNLVFAISGVVGAVAAFGASLGLLAGARLGILALYVGLLIGSLTQVVAIEIKVGLFKSAFAGRLDVNGLRALVAFSAPLAVNSASYWIFTGAGRIAISQELSLFENGIYAAASKLGSVVGLMSGVVTMVWQQVSFARGAHDRFFFESGMRAALGVYLCGVGLAIPLSVAAYGLMVSSAYQQGMALVPGFVVVAVIAGYSTFVGNIFYAIERTSVIFYSTLVVLLTVASATLPLVRAFGINGANAALVVGYVLGLVVRSWVLRRSVGIKSPIVAELGSLVVITLLWVLLAQGLVLWGGVVLAGALFVGILFVRTVLGAGENPLER